MFQLIESVKLRIDFSKNHSDFSKEFFNSRFNSVEKLSLINLSSYSVKNYASVVLSDSDDTFLGKGDDAPLFPFLYHISLIKCVT